jgi:glycine oxidase
MIQALQPRNRGHGNPDMLVIGAGVFGLWAARHAIKAGKRVLVVDKRKAGAGASGGFLGALMPHMPDRWNEKKQSQFEALTGLETAVRALEADTGMDCGYRRCGRLIPLTNERTRAIVEARIDGARQHWPGFSMSLLEPPFTGTLADGWLAADFASFGAQFDDLSARIDPRALVAALVAFVRANGALREGAEVVRLEPGRAVMADGSNLDAGEIVVANGWEAYGLLQPHMIALTGGAPIGRGVKGQAMLLAFEHTDERPILYHDGAYVVPQAGNRVAIGSSTVEDWSGEPDSFDPGDVAFAEKALALAPVLAGAPMIERWAGVRPRNMLVPRDTEAWFGQVPGLENVSACIGGFKTGLAAAWRA